MDGGMMPAAKRTVFEAISAAAADIKRLPKESKNTEQKYDFASVDDFLAMTGPICAKHGLTILMDEESTQDIEKPGKYGPTFWCRYAYAFTIIDKMGDAAPTVRRTVEVIRSGAQASGSAQSYALKQFLRATFQIPTGDSYDADHMGASPTGQVATHGPTIAGEGLYEAWMAGVKDGLPPDATPLHTAKAFAAAIIADFKACVGRKALDNRYTRHEAMILRLQDTFPELHGEVCEAYDLQIANMEPKGGAK